MAFLHIVTLLFPSERSVELGYECCFRFVFLSCLVVSFFAYPMHARECFSDYAGTHAEQSVFVASKGMNFPRLRSGKGGCLAEDMWGAGAMYRLYLSTRSGVCINDVGVTGFVPVDESMEHVLDTWFAKFHIPGEHKYLDPSFGSVSWPHRYRRILDFGVEPQLTRQATLCNF